MPATDTRRIAADPFLLDIASVSGLGAARLAAAFEAANDAFFDVDLAAGTIRWSRGITLLFGHDPDVVGGPVDRWQSLIHPEDAERVLASGRALLPSSAGVWSEEFRFRRADGSYAWVRVRSFVVPDGDRPSHVVGALADLSEVKRRDTAGALPVLTERQRRVLALLREGRTNKEIAAALGIGEQAAKVQVRKLLRKFGVPNRAALAAAARDVS